MPRVNQSWLHPALLFSILLLLGLPLEVSADWQFKSRPDLSPPKLNITVPAADSVSPGHIFIAPYTPFPFEKAEPYAPLQPAPYVFSSTGDLVWSGLGYFSGLPGNFQVGDYDGQDVLFGFEGNWAGRPGNTHGHVKMLNRHYQTIKEVRSGSNHVLDSHEFKILDGKTVLVQSNHPIPFDFSEYGMKPDSQWVMAATFQEIDLETEKVLFEWNSLDHVRPSESVNPIASFKLGTGHNSSDPVDYFHLNSIDRDSDHNYLISARHTSTIYKINGSNGDIIWRLGGKFSNFTLERGAEFYLQHDARVISKPESEMTVISLFDNYDHPSDGGDAQLKSQSSGKFLALHTKTWKSKLVQRFDAPDSIFAETQGNTQLLPDGNVFVNWGSAGAISEFSPEGSVVFHAYLDSGELFEKGNVNNYRGFKFNWTAAPTEAPAIVALRHGESTMLYVSWNGDTETKIWKFFGVDGRGEKILLGEERRTGFETGFYVSGGDKWHGFLTDALAADGKILVSSGIAKTQKYIYQYVPGRDDLTLRWKGQKILMSDEFWDMGNDPAK